ATEVGDLEGPAKEWLAEAIRALAPMRGEISSQAIGPTSPLARARLLVALVGPAAASWPTTDLGSEKELVDRLEMLARNGEPNAWSRSEVVAGGARIARVEAPKAGPDRVVWLARELGAPIPSPGVIDIAEQTKDRPPTLTFELARALVRAGDLGRARLALDGVPGKEAAALRADVARRSGDRSAARREAEAA